MKMLKKALAMMLVLVMVFSCATVSFAADRKAVVTEKGGKSLKTITNADLSVSVADLTEKAQKDLQVSKYAADDVVTAIVVMEGDAAIDVAANGTTKAIAQEAKVAKQHNALKNAMKNAGINFNVQYEYGALLNGFAGTVAYGDLAKIENMDGVSSVHIANTYDAPVVPAEEKNANANEMNGAAVLQEAGFNGKGTIVAVLDTGTRTTHEAFQDYGITDENALTKEKVEATETIGPGKYLSAKIPFACDYVGDKLDDPKYDADVTDFNGHGTHVAGSAVGYVEAEDGAVTFAGAAPGAQLLAMKIFGDSTSGTNSAVYFAAIEDAYRLGADVISMSIGAQNGFTYDRELEDEVFGDIYKKMSDNGVIMSIAAGNEGTMGDYSNSYAANAVLGSYADYGVVGSPSTYGENVSVAAIENVAYPSRVITVGEEKLPYSDASDTMESDKVKGKTFEYVMIDGYGEAADYEGVDVTGKVAVLSRGEINFADKEANAAAAGAAALIVYNNQPGTINMSIDTYHIPAVSVTQAAGEALKNAAEKKLTFDEEMATVDNDNAWLACTFSSMGTTADLKFKPTIASVGGNVFSASKSGDNGYELMSGTSMATPNASGNFAQLTQYVNESGMFNGSTTVNTPCLAEKFEDVDTSRWYHEAIDFALSEGLFAGLTETTFGPNNSLTRGMMVSVLYRQAGRPSVEGMANPFEDVPAGKFFTNAVVWAANNGIVAGITSTAFAPNSNVTREQLVSIMWRYAGRPEVTTDYLADYTDKDSASKYAIPALNWAISEKIITSTSTDAQVVSPKDDTTRAQYARILMVYLDGSYKCGETTTNGEVDRIGRSQFIKDLAYSTADVLTDNDYQLYSPRKQGAGLLDVANAVTAPAYIRSPLIELGDDPEKKGVYTMGFDVTSLSDETVYYNVDAGWTLVDSAAADEDGNMYNLMTSSYTNAAFTTSCEDNILVLPAGETKHVDVTITLDADAVEYLNTAFVNGGFVEGFVMLWQQELQDGKYVDAEGDPYIHASYLGFYGDWTKGAMLEQYDFADVIDAESFLNNTDAGDVLGEEYAGSTLADLGLTYFDLLEMDTDVNFAYLAQSENGVPTKAVDYLGGSIYFYGSQNDNYNLLSNNEDASADMVYAIPAQLRNARHLIMTVTDAETGELYYVDDTEYLPKQAYDADNGYWQAMGSFYWDGSNQMADKPYDLPTGTKVNVNYYANLPYGEDALGKIDYEDLLTAGKDYLVWNFPVAIDSEEPVLASQINRTEDNQLTVTCTDNTQVATILALDSDLNILDAVLGETVEGDSYTLDLADYTGDVYILASDYATNSAVGVIEGQGGGDVGGSTEYEWVSEITDDMSGDYAITGIAGSTDGDTLYLLNASGDVTGTDIGTAAGAVDWMDTDVMSDDNLYYLYDVNDALTWTFAKTEDGYYTICMKGSANYLACTADGKLTTVADATAAEAKWDFQMIQEPVEDDPDNYYALCDMKNVGTGLKLFCDHDNAVFTCADATYNDTYNLDVFIRVA